ncbi:hypothetical protein VNO78_03222 [Psophocarpus tetragonolobus]|uniref:Uncharacterized protein n=1 Tax=Psophocarpus tetragonolobus TaxID=3891 RepID=A0AAN9XVX6_PSOTE
MDMVTDGRSLRKERGFLYVDCGVTNPVQPNWRERQGDGGIPKSTSSVTEPNQMDVTSNVTKNKNAALNENKGKESVSEEFNTEGENRFHHDQTVHGEINYV